MPLFVRRDRKHARGELVAGGLLQERRILPAVQEAVKASTARYTAEDEAAGLPDAETITTSRLDAINVSPQPLPIHAGGTNLCATGAPDAICVIAIADDGQFLNAPDTYMQKIAVGPEARGVIDLRESPTWNLQRIAKAKNKNKPSAGVTGGRAGGAAPRAAIECAALYGEVPKRS